MMDISDQFLRQFEADDINQLRCYREVCALAFKVLTERVRRCDFPERQKAKFVAVIEDLEGLVRDRA